MVALCFEDASEVEGVKNALHELSGLPAYSEKPIRGLNLGFVPAKRKLGLLVVLK